MLKKLFGKIKSDTPAFATENGIQTLLKELPRDDIAFLSGVDDLLNKIPQSIAEVDLADCLRAAYRFDQATKAIVATLLQDYLDADSNQHLSKNLQDKLSYHVASLCAAYGIVVSDGTHALSDAKRLKEQLTADTLAKLGVEYFRAVSLENRLAKFRYRRPHADSWQRAHSLLNILEQCGVTATDAAVGESQPHSKVVREYLGIVYVALAPVSNLMPQQLEFVTRMLAEEENLVFDPAPDEHTTHMIDLSGNLGPIPYKPDYWAAAGAKLRYLSVSKLQSLVERFQGLMEAGTPLPQSFSSLPITRSQAAGVFSALKTYWTHQPPNRVNERIFDVEAMRGSLGFPAALRLVEISKKAKSDEPVTTQAEEVLHRLWHLEEQLEAKRFEDWIQVDGNDNGLGISIPAILDRHVVGSLVSLRYANEPGWHLGLIRRVGLDQESKPRIGINVFPGTPQLTTVQIRDKAFLASSGSARQSFVGIACNSGSNRLLLPIGRFIENLEVSISLDGQDRHVYLTRLIETGPDYELAEFLDA